MMEFRIDYKFMNHLTFACHDGDGDVATVTVAVANSPAILPHSAETVRQHLLNMLDDATRLVRDADVHKTPCGSVWILPTNEA